MKYIVFLGDGMADKPNEKLGFKTPLELAKKPNIDYMAANGECGLVKTVPYGMKPGSDVANLSVMGFDAAAVYTGRAPLEALSIGVNMANADAAIRCNLVTLSDEDDFNDKIMLDYSAGEISTEEARELIAAVRDALSTDKYDFYGGVSYRNCLISHGGCVTELTAPHDITGKPIGEYLPGDDELKDLIIRSYDVLKEHPVNLKRIADGKSPANAIWLWGAGFKPALPSFKELYGLRGAVISAVDLLKGIAIASDMSAIEVDGATGTLETNWEGKARAAIDALNGEYDYVYLHMEAPDECGHQGDAEGKIKAIEKIDELIGKVLSEVDAENLTVMVAPDHPTPLETRTHSSDSVPFLIYRADKEKASGVSSFTEAEAAATGIVYGSGMALTSEFLAFGSESAAEEDDYIDDIIIDGGEGVDNESVVDKEGEEECGGSSESESAVIDCAEVNTEDGAESDSAIDSEAVNAEIDKGETCSESEESDELAGDIEPTDESASEIAVESGAIDTIEPQEDAAESHMLLTDDLPPIDGEEAETEEGGAVDTDEAKKKKKDKKAKKEKRIKKSKGDKEPKEKKPLTKEQKKKRIIAISVSAVLLAIIIVLSIVLPIVILNKDKIFVSSREDFDKVNKGKYYVLEKDVVIDGDLTLAKAYTIDMNGHNLTVNGALIIAEETENNETLNIGTKKGKSFVKEGILTATSFKIRYNGKFEMHSMLVADSIEIEAKNADFLNAVQARSTIKAVNSKISFSEGAAFGESGAFGAINSTINLNGEAKADYTLAASRLYINENAATKSLTLDETSEAHVKGVVDGNITGGAKIVLSKTASAKELTGMAMLWLHDDASYSAIIGDVTVQSIIELIAPPTLSVTVSDNGRISVNVKTVSNAKRYECTVNGEILPILSSENESEPLVSFDITDYAAKYIGEIKIAVRALGGESDDVELIIPSDYTIINYQHNITLEMPQNARVGKITDENNAERYILTFDPVNFANKYKVEINGRLAFETAETSADITEYLPKVGNYSIFIQAVNTENASILNSEKALTGIEVRAKLKLGASLESTESGTQALKLTAENAKDMLIVISDATGVEIKRIRTVFVNTLDLGELKTGTRVEISLLSHGYYDEGSESTIELTVE